MDALRLLKKYADVDGKTRFYDTVDAAPMDGVVRKDWREAVVDDKGKVERIPYELCVLVALRDARLYRPDDTPPGWPALGTSLTRPIRWELIEQQYDPMVKYATALRLGTAEAEQVLRRFTRGGPKHPTYQPSKNSGARSAQSSPATIWPAPVCPGDPRRAPGRGELEQREHRAPLRQGRCPDRPGQGARRDLDARPAPAPVRARPRQNPAGSASPGRTGLGIAAERGGPARPDRAVLVQRQPVRHFRLDMLLHGPCTTRQDGFKGHVAVEPDTGLSPAGNSPGAAVTATTRP
jgi:hypothetical protein